MFNRERIIQLAVTILALAIQTILTRFGIVPPNVTIPPSTVNPQPIIQVIPPQAVPSTPSPVPISPTNPLPVPGTGQTPASPTLDPHSATVKLLANGHHCTATVIGQLDGESRQWVLSAAHCVAFVGERQIIQLRDGREFTVSVVSFNRKPDYAWLRTEPLKSELPFTLLSETPATKGNAVWHAGYGVHRPGNTEKGKVSDPTGSNDRVWFDLSVSHGDSGSGIIDTATNRVVGIVSVGSGRDPSPWTIGPDASKISKPWQSLAPITALPPCPSGTCPRS